MEALVVSPCAIIRSDGEEPPVAAAVVDEEGGRLVAGLDAVHDLHPDIDHLDSLVAGAQVADVLVQRDGVIFDSRGLGLLGLGLDVVPDALQIGLVLGGKLSRIVNEYSFYNERIRENLHPA